SRAGEDPRPGMALIHGRPMVGYVVDALRQANGIAPLLAVVRPDMPDVAGVDRRVDAAGDMVANVGAGLQACAEAGGAFLTSADSPFITSEAVEDFVARCLETGASLCYGVVRRDVNETRFPTMHRTYARLAEGEFTGGNAFYVR